MNDQLRDIKPPIDVPISIWLIIGVTVFILSLIGSAIWFYLKRKNKLSGQPAMAKSSAELAYERLDILKKEGMIEKGLVKQYYSELSVIVRYYIEDFFHLNAPEMTTQEFLDSLKGSQDLSDQHKNLLGKFLENCDLVKFAKFSPESNEHQASFQLVQSFVKDTYKVDVET